MEAAKHIHPHTLESYFLGKAKFKTRQREILRFLIHRGKPFTDRELMIELGFFEMNQVRPRITELLRIGAILEVGKTKCPVTRRTVRKVAAPKQLQLQLS